MSQKDEGRLVMAELRIDTLEMPAADLGPENPLPPLRPLRTASSGIEFDESVPAEDRTLMLHGFDAPLLPYHIQDSYNRDRRPRTFRTAVLENEFLRATFVIGLGGRLWSLWHKRASRELLDANPVFQPANLAIRNAWFCGGVEWNCSLPGHSVHTCSPLFVARLRRGDGAPVLRMYEWERVRGVTYQIDACLPDGSAFLYVHVRIVNPHDAEIPMYWWSNLAARETPETRVIVPADSALHFRDRRLRLDGLPQPDGVDVTRPAGYNRADELFFRIPDGERPWIAAIEADGRGIVHTSTRRLKGRKLFVWGMSPGGRRWQEYLSTPGEAYIELQAGLCRTQLECVPMPGRAAWSWTEAYGLMEVAPAVAHGNDWAKARRAVADRLDRLVPEERIEAEHAAFEAVAEHPPEEILQRGSGWGALERRRREKAGERPFCSSGTPFDDASLAEDQAPWLVLLQDGRLPERDPSEPPGLSLVQAEWREMLEAAVRNGAADTWLAWIHLGVMRFANGEKDAARDAWERSVSLEPSAWALRNLAALALDQGRLDQAADLYLKAWPLAQRLRPLAVECLAALLKAERPRDALSVIERLCPELRADGRIRLLEALARLATNDLDEVERILLAPGEFPDVREGEVLTSDIWFRLQEQRVSQAEGVPIDDALKARVRSDFPPPRHLDFRMNGSA